MQETTLQTQPSFDRLRSLLSPIVREELRDSEHWLRHTYAAIVWSHMTEPSDITAGQLTGVLGYPTALELVSTVGSGPVPEAVDRIQEALMREQTLMQDADLLTGVRRWRPRANEDDVLHSIEVAAAKGMTVITPWDELYPDGLHRLGEATPHVLWVRGDIDVLASRLAPLAIVGARAATSYGEHIANELAADLARDHLIVSGAAYGIDGVAHRAALASGGKTIAFLAGGADRPYPAGHANLIDRVVENGAVISEIPPGGTPTKWRFLQRNRLIAASTSATVVVEAGYRSGSLSTAAHARAAGRRVGAVPGPLTSAASAGCHRLIRDYAATLITEANDVRQLTGAPLR